MTCIVLQPATAFFHCCLQIAQVEYQGQALNTRILNSKPEFLTANLLTAKLEPYYCIGQYIGVEIFSLCTILLIKQLINLKKVRNENLKFRIDLKIE